ncbi:MAG: hypothetical protein U5N53_19515 [Mycobacterium sp.]|nr:hypothetical protein [Mycobacterium sp.]
MTGTDIGYYTLPVMVSMDGIDRQMNATLGKAFGNVGKKASKDLAAGMATSEADVKRVLDSYAKLYDKAADQAGKLKTAEAGLDDLRKKGITSGQRYERAVAAQEKAQRDHTRALREAGDAYGEYERAAKRASEAADTVGDGLLSKLKGMAGGAASSASDLAPGSWRVSVGRSPRWARRPARSGSHWLPRQASAWARGRSLRRTSWPAWIARSPPTGSPPGWG